MTSSNGGGFFQELRRRNVVRVAIAFVIVAWLLLQVVDILIPMLSLPEWVGRLVLLLIAIAFPISLLLAWAFELTPDGVKREKDVDRSQSVTSDTGRKLDRMIIGVLAVAVVALTINQFRDSPGESDDGAGAQIERSIAVMPFVDLSSDQNDDFFGKGVAEELLNALAKFPDLRVAARTSAFALGGQELDLREVGEQLGVAHVLEGSVRRAGEQLRITAQLIRAADGMHLWSETYDRPEADVLAIQDAIVGDISRALEIRLGVGAGAGRARQHNVDPRAYETYLQGLFLFSTRHVDGNRAGAIKQLRLSAELDPDFADAHAAYALALLFSSDSQELTGVSSNERTATISRALAVALALDPTNARVHAAYGTYFSSLEINMERAVHHLQEAVRLAPNSALPHYASAMVLSRFGDFEQAQRSLDRTLLLDPLNRTVARVQAQFHVVSGQWGPAAVYFERCSDQQCGGDFEGLIYYYLIAQIHMEQEEGALLTLNAMDEELTERSQADEEFVASARAMIEPANDPDYWRNMALTDDVFTTNPIVITALLRASRFDDVLQAFYNSSNNGSFWTLFSGPLLLSEGRFQLPDEFRKYPGYQAFWSRDGWREIAATRIANGHPEGLPLNADGSLVEY